MAQFILLLEPKLRLETLSNLITSTELGHSYCMIIPNWRFTNVLYPLITGMDSDADGVGEDASLIAFLIRMHKDRGALEKARLETYFDKITS